MVYVGFLSTPVVASTRAMGRSQLLRVSANNCGQILKAYFEKWVGDSAMARRTSGGGKLEFVRTLEVKLGWGRRTVERRV